MNAERKALLETLIALDKDLKVIMSGLERFEWDCETPIVHLKGAHIAAILQRFVEGNLSPGDVEDWANAVEGREDVGGWDSDDLTDVVFVLANPSINEPLTEEAARRWIAQLTSDK